MPQPIFYFMRHGETDWNVEGRLQGQHDTPLNAVGLGQASCCGDILRALLERDGRDPRTFDYVASPLVRARRTMELVRAELGLDAANYRTDPRLAELLRGADLVITATSATQIVLEGSWLAPGMHINAMGANWAQKRELDAAAVARSDLVAVDSIEQAKMEAGDLVQAFGDDAARWDKVRELSEIVAGKIPGRSSTNQITLFKSIGIATWDLAAAVRIYELAVAKGMGQSVPLWEPHS